MKAEIINFLKGTLSKVVTSGEKFLEKPRPLLLPGTIFFAVAGILEVCIYYAANVFGLPWFVELMCLVGGVIIIIIATLFLTISIPAYNFGVVERFGKRTRVLYEGLNLRLPFEEVKFISMEVISVEVKTGFTTFDKLHLTCVGSLQYRANPDVRDEENRNVFVTMSESIIKSGIVAGIEAKLGALGGVYKGEDFIQSRHAIADIINAFLRLGTLPHEEHQKNGCGVQDCKFIGQRVEAKDLIEFYNSHWDWIKKMLSETQGSSQSGIETLYGIDIRKFELSDISFEKETKEAFEKEQQVKAKKNAYLTKLAMAKITMRKLGASPQVALNSVDVALDPQVKKSVVSVEGEIGVLGGLLGKLTNEGGR
ncbi:MAG: SPFH domain-containing protein [Candidatus Jorgensenbacteria bacterium]|nr:SPFH domain-containing protein [Candidatus Jorgensenbacteria bacterium]